MHLNDQQYTIAALSQAIADNLPQSLVWQAWHMSEDGAQFDAAVSASIRLQDMVTEREAR